MSHTKKIAVIGAGIAGVTTAIGLKKLGFDVSIFYKNRVFTAYEGFSEKTKDGLKMIACKEAFASLNVKSQRDSNWANIKKSINYEYVVCRDDFDKALKEDAKNFNIRLIESSVVGEIDFTNKPIVKYKINDKQNFMEVDFIVDTRGRFTPYKNEYKSGPKSFSILQELEVSEFSENKTSIDSIKDGWVWQAYVGENRAYLQFTCDEEIANNIKSFGDILPYLKDQDLDLWTLKNYKVKEKIVKRDSYTKIHKTIINDKMILIGDSASSIDPLSGNGAFQALSMSSIAPYVINTILNKNKNKDVAIAFYKKRVNHIFEKFSKVGKEFYKMESRFKSDFWNKRQAWPKENNHKIELTKIEKSAIIRNGFVEEKEVVITKDNPLGVYFLGDVEIVEIVKYYINSKDKSLEFFEEFTKNFDKKFKYFLQAWLLKYDIL